MDTTANMDNILKDKFENSSVKELAEEIYLLGDSKIEVFKSIDWKKNADEIIQDLEIIKQELLTNKKEKKKENRNGILDVLDLIGKILGG